MNIKEYNSIIFDCDGVILNSNRIKSLAFYETVKEFGENCAIDLYNFHILNGGISRYSKFEYFKNQILKTNSLDINLLLNNFSSIVLEQLIKSDVAFGLDILRENTNNVKWSVVSGGDQFELIEVFNKKNIQYYFDDGIFGSPDDKFKIIETRMNQGKYSDKVLFLGDSKLDYEVATHFGFDFIFIYQWTEFQDWKIFCKENNVIALEQPFSILKDFE